MDDNTPRTYDERRAQLPLQVCTVCRQRYYSDRPAPYVCQPCQRAALEVAAEAIDQLAVEQMKIDDSKIRTRDAIIADLRSGKER